MVEDARPGTLLDQYFTLVNYNCRNITLLTLAFLMSAWEVVATNRQRKKWRREKHRGRMTKRQMYRDTDSQQRRHRDGETETQRHRKAETETQKER